MSSKAFELKKKFREHGLSPKKWMGQNLLVDTRYLSRIVEAADIKPGDHVVEVGAGLGDLTEALASKGATVYALEIDAGFFRVLEEKFGDSHHVELVRADALKYDFRELAGRIGRLRVVANLPYNISSRLMFRFYEHREVFSSLSILLQKEVAERLTADPGTKDYGILTVLLGVSARVRILFDIPPRAFYPVPAVTSTLVRISFPLDPPVPVSDPELLTRLVKASLARRRKTLRNNLRDRLVTGVPSEIIIDSANDAAIDLGRRGETLSPDEFVRLVDAIHSRMERNGP
jgi:16S rRNA (adenine1518-N6/adenine1519-N6)-dimethyltransferase